MLTKDLEKLPRKTLRERIYEEVVRLIVSGELPSGGWLDEKQVIDRLQVSRTPFREAIGTLAKGGLVEIKPYRGFYVRSFSRNETADLYELYKRLECFAVELAVPQMSDRDIRRFENTLIEAVIALQRGDILRGHCRAIRKFRADRGAGAACASNPALRHHHKPEPRVRRARRARLRRHHPSIQGARHCPCCLSGTCPDRLRTGIDSCALPQ